MDLTELSEAENLMIVNRGKTTVKQAVLLYVFSIRQQKSKINEFNYPCEEDDKYWWKTTFKQQLKMMGSWKIFSSEGRKPRDLPQLQLCPRSLLYGESVLDVIFYTETTGMADLSFEMG